MINKLLFINKNELIWWQIGGLKINTWKSAFGTLANSCFFYVVFAFNQRNFVKAWIFWVWLWCIAFFASLELCWVFWHDPCSFWNSLGFPVLLSGPFSPTLLSDESKFERFLTVLQQLMILTSKSSTLHFDTFSLFSLIFYDTKNFFQAYPSHAMRWSLASSFFWFPSFAAFVSSSFKAFACLPGGALCSHHGWKLPFLFVWHSSYCFGAKSNLSWRFFPEFLSVDL